MQIFAFESSGEVDLVGFSRDKTGSNLPLNYGPWVANGSIFIQEADSATSDLSAFLKAIETEGYVLSWSHRA